ncbi:type II toxin-antitoxin system RelE/ParE family toxin, partial [Acinetobacter baumannii]
MLTIRTTEVFDAWFAKLRDKTAQRRIQVRIDRLQLGNPGDAKAVRDGISELRIDHGPGYRVYFVQRGAVLIILLCGG